MGVHEFPSGEPSPRDPIGVDRVVEQLAGGRKSLNEISLAVGLETNAVANYLTTLVGLRLVSKTSPFGVDANSRSGRWQLDDEFLSFWFRFVFPFQSDLESGLAARSLFDTEFRGRVAEHVSPTSCAARGALD